MLVARRKFDQLGAPGVQPHPERAAPRRAAQVVGDLRACRRTAAGCARGSRRTSASVMSTAAVTLDEQRPGQRIGQHRRGDAADLQPGRGVRAAARPRAGAPSAVNPRAAASAATTRSVTSSCVSQRRSCLPSLVPRRGSDDASREPRNRSSRASTSSTPHRHAADDRRDRSSHRHLHRGRIDQPARAADPDQRPPLAGLHPDRRRDVEAQFHGAARRQLARRTPRAPSTPMSPTG